MERFPCYLTTLEFVIGVAMLSMAGIVSEWWQPIYMLIGLLSINAGLVIAAIEGIRTAK